MLPFEVALRDLFETSTVAKLAQHLRALGRAAGSDVEELCRTLLALTHLSDEDVRARLASNT